LRNIESSLHRVDSPRLEEGEALVVGSVSPEPTIEAPFAALPSAIARSLGPPAHRRYRRGGWVIPALGRARDVATSGQYNTAGRERQRRHRRREKADFRPPDKLIARMMADRQTANIARSAERHSFGKYATSADPLRKTICSAEYPASSLIRTHPPPQKGPACPSRDSGWPVTLQPPLGASRGSPCARMPPPIPRWNRRVLVSLSSPSTAAFPVSKSGQLPHRHFRSLLSVHCTLQPGLAGSPV
jgi:hypothetical protein